MVSLRVYMAHNILFTVDSTGNTSQLDEWEETIVGSNKSNNVYPAG